MRMLSYIPPEILPKELYDLHMEIEKVQIWADGEKEKIEKTELQELKRELEATTRTRMPGLRNLNYAFKRIEDEMNAKQIGLLAAYRDKEKNA